MIDRRSLILCRAGLLDQLLQRGDTGGRDQIVDRYRQRQSGAVPPPREGRLQRNRRQQEASIEQSGSA